MDDTTDGFFRPSAQSALVSLSPFAPFPTSTTRRLSSHFVARSQPVVQLQSQSARKLAWVSLQGRIVGAEEATSATVIGGGLSNEEAVAWELFSPMHRILIVAVVAVAAAQSRKNREIRQLKISVQLRDQVLSVMQQKLDNLCEQVNYFKGQPLGGVNLLSMKSERISADEASDCENTTATGLNDLDNRRHSLTSVCSVDSLRKTSVDYNNTIHAEHLIHNDDQQEERRLSGLSDWASSVTSTSDFQLASLEQDIQHLKQKCEEKDAMIQDLSIHLKSVDAASAKRIAELEDIVRRKNARVVELQKGMLVLEQKVMQLTRAKRPSASKSTLSSHKVPFMSENVLYDMDSTTSPSSDSDCSRDNEHSMARKNQDSHVSKVFVATRIKCIASETELNNSSIKLVDHRRSSHPDDPIQEISENQRHACSKMATISHRTEDLRKMRRRQPPSGFRSGFKNASSSKRWL